MTFLGLRFSHYVNGVTMHHGEISRDMASQDLWFTGLFLVCLTVLLIASMVLLGRVVPGSETAGFASGLVAAETNGPALRSDWLAL